MNPIWNGKEKRVRALWRLVLQAVLVLICSGVLQAGLFLLIITSAGIAPAELADANRVMRLLEESPLASMGTPFVTLFSMLGSIWLAGLILDRRSMADFGFRLNKRNWWIDWGFGLALGAVLMAFIFLIELAAGWVSIEGSFASGSKAGFGAGIVQSLLLFFCVGIYEEAFSRGYQLRNLAEGLNLRFIGSKWSLLIGYFVSSSVFGMLHLGNPNSTWISTVNLVVAGLFLGLGYVLTGELAISIGLHMTWNFFQGNVFGFPVSGTQAGATFIKIKQAGPDVVTGGAFGPEAGLIGLLAIAVGCALTVAWVKYRYGKVELHTRLAEYSRPGMLTATVLAAAPVAAAGEAAAEGPVQDENSASEPPAAAE